MLLLKMVVVPFLMFILGGVMMLETPPMVALLAGCGLASAIIYARTPYSSGYGYKPYIAVTAMLLVQSLALMAIGYTGG